MKVYNEYFFTDLSRYAMQWEVTCNGESVLSGTLAPLDVAPQTTATLRPGYTREELAAACPDLERSDIFLDVRYTLKSRDGLLPAGTGAGARPNCHRTGAALRPQDRSGNTRRRNDGGDDGIVGNDG